MTLLAVHLCASGSRKDCKTWKEATTEWTTNCMYTCDITLRQRRRGEHDPEVETRCFCEFKRLRRKVGDIICRSNLSSRNFFSQFSIVDLSIPGCNAMRKIGSLQETQSDFMEILISQFAKSQAEIRSLMVLQRTDADGSRSVGISVMARFQTLPTVIGCLEVMESVSKMIPGFGGIVEGACATLRKILSSAEVRVLYSFPCLLLSFSERRRMPFAVYSPVRTRGTDHMCHL